MKRNDWILTLFFLLVSVGLKAQSDSSSARREMGYSIYGSIGFLPNSSLQSMADELEAVAVKPFGQVMSNLILGMRREDASRFYESRLVFFGTPVRKDDNPGKYATLNGLGIGMDFGPKLVNSARWNILIPIGWDVNIYRLRVKSDHEVDLIDLVQNTTPFQPVKLFSSNLVLNAGIGADYKMQLLPKIYDKVYLSSKLSYHLPIFEKSKWRGEDVTVNDLSTFKPNQLYFQLGLIFFPKKGGYHHHW
jgi:hypothetical protein